MAIERTLLEASLAAGGMTTPSPDPANDAGLSRYLPHCVLEQLEPPGGKQRHASLDRFDGVVLFTDIAGFSRLTDQFSARGPEGVEQLSSMLDNYFGRMTEIALNHGGDVVDFVGDAIVVMWPGANSLADSVGAAVYCGLELQNALKDVMAATGLPLQQRVSISAGELAQFIVGGIDGKWRWLIAGEPMRQAGASNHQAQPGEVLVCAPAWTLIRERCRGRELDAGYALVDQISPSTRLARRDASARSTAAGPRLEEFVARPLLERFRAGHWDWLGEFRNVSAVFVGFPGLDVSSPGALDDLQYTAECAQREFGRYGGSLENLSMDDKGVSALAAFGLPAGMHEDDSVRALRAAMSLAARLKARGIACSIGITHGRVFYGDSGGASRRHVALVGGMVNLAARLMQAAGGGILCDEATRHSAGPALGFSAGVPLQVKGQPQAVAVYTPGPSGAAEPSRQEVPIIGRTLERQRIALDLQALLRGSGGLLLLRGEAGIGKSRLLRDAVQQARQRTIRGLTSHASSIESATPYFAWRRLLQQMLLGDAPFDSAAARTELDRRLRGEELLGSWAPLLNDILPLEIPDNAITRQMESGSRASSTRALLIHLLRQLATERATLLAVDDLHWCDEASAGILAAAVEAVPQLLLLAGTRPLEPSAAQATTKLLRAGETQTLLLDQLPREELDLLACNKLGVRELPRELGDFIYARTGGNPFYSEELLLALRSAALIETSDGECRVGAEFLSTGLATMPTTLHGVIISRVDRLAPAEQLTLKLISVIGREFSLAMLRQLHPVAEDAAGLEAIFTALQAADIIKPAASGTNGEYAVKHAILREVIYDLLPYAQRRQFHRDIALWIEKNQARHLEPYYAELALHWEKAGEVSQAIDYLEKAGALAFDRFANRPAIQHIRKAYALAQRHGIALERERITICEGILGDSHQELFEYDKAAVHFKRCLGHLGLPAPESRVGLAAGLLKELLLQLRLRLLPRRGTGAALPAPGAESRIRRAAHIYQRLAESSFFDNRPLDLLYQIIASVNLAERSGATREIVDGFGAIAVVAVAAGLRRASHYYNRRSMEITRGAGNPVDAAYGYLVDMVYWATLGVWDRQTLSHAPSEQIYRQLGGAVRWQQTQSVTYTALILQGRYDEAETVLQGAKAAMNPDVPSQILSFWYCSMLDLALVRAQPLEPLIAGLEAAQGSDLHRADRVRSLGLIAKARWRLGQRGEAAAAADAALDLVRQSLPTPYHVCDGIAALAEVYMDQWESGGPDPQAQKKSREVCKAMLNFARRVPSGFPAAAVQYARYHQLSGRHRPAIAWWRRAATAAEQMNTALEQGLALRQLGIALPEAEGGGMPSLLQAQTIFQRIGAVHDAKICADLLA